jgi:hypothetical protein
MGLPSTPSTVEDGERSNDKPSDKGTQQSTTHTSLNAPNEVEVPESGVQLFAERYRAFMGNIEVGEDAQKSEDKVKGTGKGEKG